MITEASRIKSILGLSEAISEADFPVKQQLYTAQDI